MAMLSFTTDVVSLFKSYGEYHTNLINKLIHIVFVPTLYVTLMSLLCSIPLGYLDKGNVLMIHPGSVITLVMSVVYIKLDYIVGIVCLLIYLPGYALGCQLFNEMGEDHLRIIGIIHAFSWIAQFIGHGLFEHRRPALVDNILLTLAAPMFVVMEVMFYLGYHPSYFKEIEEFEEQEAEKKKVK